MAKGEGLLKITGIIMLMFGGFWFVLGLLSFVTAIGALFMGLNILNFLSVCFTFACSICFLLTGVSCVKNCKETKGAMNCLIFAIVLIIMSVVDNAVLPMFVPDDYPTPILLLICVVLGILVIIGASANLSSQKEGSSETKSTKKTKND